MAFNFFKKKKQESKDSQYYNLTVKEIIRETKDAVSIVFEQPASGNIAYKPGQFVTLIQTVNGKKIRRAYSLCSSPHLGESPTVMVKRVENGQMSNHVNDELKAGQEIEIMEPMGSFVLDIAPSNKRHLFLFGGGSGITPLLSITKSILKEEPNSKVSLVYANKDEDSVIFKLALEKLKSENEGRLDIIHFLEEPPADWPDQTGYVTSVALTKIISDLKDEAYSHVEHMTCGPEPMMNIVMDTLDQLGVPADKKHKESFVAAGSTAPSDTATASKNTSSNKVVTIRLEGEEYQYEVPTGKSILEAGLDENIDMPYSCQSGLCTACRGKCVQGKIKMDEDDGLSEEEKSEGYVLLCVGHAESDDVIVEIG